ncbi:uncharacterized protein TRIADDRAFT_52339 [Trichoplax adhaerens]|uniref:Acid phosphatase n=1 Tax=Trichoplax adhaerens TaxID=10228 RepID=B3RI07_TRIAD|nr:hypothetical protein TRIADDRAFT_52339 [Trichoplax adhaerens]EDV28954.1 hypothetical protein TRIADDRAFT_52339 [Trichoplax adhaerens]|eukprot:XP_002108156.1 hypothetical protein TRIADDRAFT_52339 [Trichoplax adhaerens]
MLYKHEVGALMITYNYFKFSLPSRLPLNIIYNAYYLNVSYQTNFILIANTKLKNSKAIKAITSVADDPIILHTTESKNEFLYPNVGSCPLMKKFYRAVHKHNEFESAGRRIFHDVLQIDDMKSLYENKLLAKNHIDILDDLESRRAHGMALPDVLIDHYSQIKEIGYKALCSLFSENVLLKVSSGRFMDDILKRMDAVVNNQRIMDLPIMLITCFRNSPTRLCLYSAHDTSLIVLSAAVTGKLPNAWPPFASFLVFELYRTFSGKHYVKVKFENQDLVINNCGGSTECPYNRFREIVSELALESKEFEELCSIQDGN